MSKQEIKASATKVGVDKQVIPPPNVWELLEIAESANPPKRDKKYFHEDVIFNAKNGWRVSFFYDGDELDYIDKFIRPDGTIIDFWEWEESKDKTILTCWRSVGDIERLKTV